MSRERIAAPRLVPTLLRGNTLPATFPRRSHVRPNRQNIVLLQANGDRRVVVMSGCTVLHFDSPDSAALYSFVLRQSAVTYQLMRWNVGTSYPAVESVPVDRILVPDFLPSQYQEFWQQARAAVDAPRRAKALVKSAVAEVEALIEGSLDESRCLAQGRELAAEFGLEAP